MREGAAYEMANPGGRQDERKKKLRNERLRRENRLALMARAQRWLKLAGLGAALFVALLLGGLLYLRSQALPAATVSQTSQLLDIRGNVIDTFHTGENRSSVPLSEISPYAVQATLAIEDKRFYKHFGFDMRGMARAVLVNVESLSKRQGASTLTQQLARNLYLTHARTWTRKLREAAYTAKLEMSYSKDEILTLYMNQIYYGHGAYGIEAAAQRYFGKKAAELSLAEGAMLAGVPKGPKYYSPYLNMKNAKDRQRIILNEMAAGGVITKAEADAAFQEVLAFKPASGGDMGGFAPFFRDYVRQVAIERIGIEELLLNEGGIRIYTTLDPEAQRAAEAAIRDGFPSDSEQQAALIAVDPRTGYIKAMVGGRDYKANQYNRVFAKTRQPGSSFKPVVYLTALESGGMTPLTKFKSEPTVFTYDEGRKTYEPRNYNDKYANEEIDMRQAIASSDNIYAVNTVMAAGPDKVIEMARRLGIESPMKPVPSLALGTFPVSPFEMASAFGTIANAGVRAEPTAIVRIEDRNGRILYEAERSEKRVVDAAHAYVLTRLMQSVFEPGGTASRVAAMIKRPVAGKTGTTANDAWLVGYTPELAVAVWVGYDKNRSITPVEAHRAAPIFAGFMDQALAAVPPKLFPMPEGVISLFVDPGTGKAAAASCPNRRLETFVAGTEPTEICGEHDDAADGEARDGAAARERESWWADLKRWWQR
ncbi:carboxypeptidase [Paenibacillus darwinianus]|nr:carboxypeptidase [Paenibacillus darwinianus]